MQRTGTDEVTFSRRALEMLNQCNWTENIRELSNLVEKLSTRYPEREIDVDELPPDYQSSSVAGDATATGNLRPRRLRWTHARKDWAWSATGGHGTDAGPAGAG